MVQGCSGRPGHSDCPDHSGDFGCVLECRRGLSTILPEQAYPTGHSTPDDSTCGQGLDRHSDVFPKAWKRHGSPFLAWALILHFIAAIISPIQSKHRQTIIRRLDYLRDSTQAQQTAQTSNILTGKVSISPFCIS